MTGESGKFFKNALIPIDPSFFLAILLWLFGDVCFFVSGKLAKQKH